MTVHNVAGISFGDVRADVSFDVEAATDDVLAVIVATGFPLELAVLSPTGANVIARDVYPVGSFTTTLAKPRRFKFSTFDWSISLSSRRS